MIHTVYPSVFTMIMLYLILQRYKNKTKCSRFTRALLRKLVLKIHCCEIVWNMLITVAIVHIIK